jgi:hypothetical protein
MLSAMRCAAAWILVLGACGFHSNATGPEDARLDDAEPVDTSPPLDMAPPDMAPPDMAPPAPFCDPGDVHTIACYDFDGNASDESGNHLDTTATNVSFVPGQNQVGMAMQLANNSQVSVGDSRLFDITELTIEAWIRPSQLPQINNRAGIVDVEGQYGFFLYPGTMLTCTLVGGPGSVNTPLTAIAVNRWTHVACTYDRSISTIYVDGIPIVQATSTGALATNGVTGMSIGANNPPGTGDRLIGLIDQVRLMDRARTAAEICADAGKTSCP